MIECRKVRLSVTLNRLSCPLPSKNVFLGLGRKRFQFLSSAKKGDKPDSSNSESEARSSYFADALDDDKIPDDSRR